MSSSMPAMFGSSAGVGGVCCSTSACGTNCDSSRSEEHTSELQSQSNLVCRLLLEKKSFQTAQQLALHQIGHALGTLRCFSRFLKLISQSFIYGKHLGIIFSDSIIADHALAAGLLA